MALHAPEYYHYMIACMQAISDKFVHYTIATQSQLWVKWGDAYYSALTLKWQNACQVIQNWVAQQQRQQQQQQPGLTAVNS